MTIAPPPGTRKLPGGTGYNRSRIDRCKAREPSREPNPDEVGK